MSLNNYIYRYFLYILVVIVLCNTGQALYLVLRMFTATVLCFLAGGPSLVPDDMWGLFLLLPAKPLPAPSSSEMLASPFSSASTLTFAFACLSPLLFLFFPPLLPTFPLPFPFSFLTPLSS